MPKSGFNLKSLVIDYSQEEAQSRLRHELRQERETLEEVALFKIETGTVQEKILALDSLGNRASLQVSTLFKLQQLRDEFKTVEDLEEVVAIINHAYLSHRHTG